MATKPYIIALEEHYADPDVQETFTGPDAAKAPRIAQRLDDVGSLRIREMDEAGIDMQVLSHTAPATPKLDAESSVRLARIANDRLYETVRTFPNRFAGFATLPTPDPKTAADELERAVTKLGFKGAMVHGMTHGRFLDDKQFWPIFERAEALDVPLYFHPAIPHPAVIETYYKEYAKDWPMFIRAAWGFTVETATQGIRLVLSGVFDEYPKLKIILGHLGEGLPFYLWRIDHSLKREGRDTKSFRDCFCAHFYITTSGFFSNPALLCCVQELGIDRILFSVDYPFVDNMLATKWLETLPLCTEDREKLVNGNARRLDAPGASEHGLLGRKRLRSFRILDHPPDPRGRERQRVRFRAEIFQRRRDRIRDHAADRNDAAFAGPLGAERIVGRGCVLQRDHADARKFAGRRHQIVGERYGEQLPVRIVDQMFGERAAQSLHDRAQRLAVQHHRIDDAPDVLDGDIIDKGDMPGRGVDGDVGRMRAIGIGALPAGIGAFDR
jgi:predicted TIM-barrel fold metal-dependent hydrolase